MELIKSFENENLDMMRMMREMNGDGGPPQRDGNGGPPDGGGGGNRP